MLSEGQRYDLVIIGSGAAAISAALLAKKVGRSAIVLEKTDKLGGNTALSGGVMWVPNNPAMKRAGIPDTPRMALAYLDACAGPEEPELFAKRRAEFVKEGPNAIAFLEELGLSLQLPRGYSDYHEPEFKGGLKEGRSIVARPFNLNRLGVYANKMRRHSLGVEAPASLAEFGKLGIGGRTLESKRTFLHVGVRMIANKLGANWVSMGAALYGRLLRIALDLGVEFVTEANVQRLITQDGAVRSVVVRHEGRDITLHANYGVVIASGGFARNQDLREKYLPGPTSNSWSLSNPGETGDLVEQVTDLGGFTHNMDVCVWLPATPMEPGVNPATTVYDLGRPHAMIVDQTGQRYVNECASYVAIGSAMYERHKVVPAVPSWGILDVQHSKKYMMAGKMPGRIPRDWFDKGYIIQASSLDELAEKCGMSKEILRATVDRFNGFARDGVDRDFDRGVGGYNQFFGDASNPLNPNLGTIEKPPFLAVRVVPGDCGTLGGLATDEYARVLRADGGVLAGLYAAGIAAAPVGGRHYPGAGASIGPALTFGYVAAKHALGYKPNQGAAT